MRKQQKIPSFVARCLWSYDIRRIDLQQDKELIITQVLNYGDEKRIKWLYSVYPEKEIKKVVAHPGRGLWFEKVLNFWEIMFGIRLPAKVKQKAIFSIQPQSLSLK